MNLKTLCLINKYRLEIITIYNFEPFYVAAY